MSCFSCKIARSETLSALFGVDLSGPNLSSNSILVLISYRASLGVVPLEQSCLICCQLPWNCTVAEDNPTFTKHRPQNFEVLWCEQIHRWTDLQESSAFICWDQDWPTTAGGLER